MGTLRKEEGVRFVQLVERDHESCARLERSFASEISRRDRAERRAQIGILDHIAAEARSCAAKNSLLEQQQARVEEQLAALKRRREVADEAARQRWLATSARSIGASATRHSIALL